MRVAAVGFSPIKGTRHLSYDEVRLDPDGLVGDRGYCLVDVAARRVLRTVQHGALVAVEARAYADSLTVALPDGSSATGCPEATGERLTCEYWGRPAELDLLDGPHSDLFSDYLGKPVRLARAPRRAVVYGAGVTILSRGSLAELARRLGGDGLDAHRFRASVVVDQNDAAADASDAEDRWAGRLLTLGEAVVRVGEPVPRCAVVDLSPASGIRDLPVLRELAGYRPRASTGEPVFGVYAEVVVPGGVRAGDAAGLAD